MKPGPKQTPAALKVARGNPGKRKIQEEVDLPPGVPEMPKFAGFDATAKKEWKRVVELLPPGVLSPADQMVLAGYCCAVSRAIRVEKLAKQDPGYMARAEKAWVEVRKFAALFGLGPAERSRVKATVNTGEAVDDVRSKRFFG